MPQPNKGDFRKMLLALPASDLVKVWVKAVGLMPDLVLGEEEEGHVAAYQGMPDFAKDQMNKRILRLLDRAISGAKRPGRE